jgi:glutathione S-transferase
MSGLVVLGDLISQPARSVWWFCKLAKIPHKFQQVIIAKGQNKDPDYVKKYSVVSLI